MKKIFFASILLIVAVGGALSSKAIMIIGYEFGQNTSIICNEAFAISCVNLMLFDRPVSAEGWQLLIPAGDYEDLFHN